MLHYILQGQCKAISLGGPGSISHWPAIPGPRQPSQKGLNSKGCGTMVRVHTLHIRWSRDHDYNKYNQCADYTWLRSCSVVDLLFFSKPFDQTLRYTVIINILKNISYTQNYHHPVCNIDWHMYAWVTLTYTAVSNVHQHVGTGAVPNAKGILKRGQWITYVLVHILYSTWTEVNREEETPYDFLPYNVS